MKSLRHWMVLKSGPASATIDFSDLKDTVAVKVCMTMEFNYNSMVWISFLKAIEAVLKHESGDVNVHIMDANTEITDLRSPKNPSN